MREHVSVVTGEQSPGDYSENQPPLPHLTEKQEPRKTLVRPVFALLLSSVFFYFMRTNAPKLGYYSLAIFVINGVGWVLCLATFVLGYVEWLRQRKEDAR